MLKLNGSAVETLFSQYKFAAGGKLTAISFSHAKRSVMLKRNVSGKHPLAKGYRDVALSTMSIPLKRSKKH